MLISILHLLWIVPLSAFGGVILMAMCIAASKRDDWRDKK